MEINRYVTLNNGTKMPIMGLGTFCDKRVRKSYLFMVLMLMSHVNFIKFQGPSLYVRIWRLVRF